MEGRRVNKDKTKRKSKAKFKRNLKIYCVFLLIIMTVFLIHVFRILKEYESNQPKNYISKSLQDLSKNKKIYNYIDKNTLIKSKYEDDKIELNDALKELLDQNVTYKLAKESNDEKHPIYDVYSNNNLILKVKLNGEKVVNRLKLFSYSKWKMESIENELKDGLYTQNIIVPSDYIVYINGKELEKDQIKEEDKQDALKELSNYTDIVYLAKYEIKNLFKEPKVEIKNKNGEKVEYTKENNTIKVDLKTEKIESKDEALNKIKNAPDILNVARDWSLFLSDDLKGGSHGYNSIKKYLIPDSYLYKYAYKWATGVDITFISTHKLLNPTFTEEKIQNFEIYNDNSFSCEVYLEKNLSVSGKKMIDKMHERMYFVYLDNEWKLVNMQSM